MCLASSQPTMSDAECIASQSDLPPKVGDASLAATRDDAHIAEPGMDSMYHALTTTVGSHVYNGDGPSEPIALTSQPAVCLVCNGNKNERHTCGKRRNAPAATSITPDRSKRARRATLALMPPSEVHGSVLCRYAGGGAWGWGWPWALGTAGAATACVWSVRSRLQKVWGPRGRWSLSALKWALWIAIVI